MPGIYRISPTRDIKTLTDQLDRVLRGISSDIAGVQNSINALNIPPPTDLSSINAQIAELYGLVTQRSKGVDLTTVVGGTTLVTTVTGLVAGLKSQRVTTGSIGASSDADVTLTWAAAFADTSYTAVASVVEAGANLSVVGIKTIAAGSVVVTIRNSDAGGAHTGTLHVIAKHD